MNFIDVAMFILFFAIISVPIANRFHLSLEVFLVIGSCLISFLPGLPQIQLNPDVVFRIFLPPILFYAAYFTSWRDFKFNIRPISLLACGLVVFTTCMVAVISKMIFPDFTWAEGFLLGAIISPTDAASATAIIKKLGAPRRLVTILEGESLINDATALILFRFSLAAVLMGSFSFPHAIIEFVTLATGGTGIGLVIGMIAAFILQRIHSIVGETTLTFVTAFSCYLLAEHLQMSGVISTVVCGIYFGIRFPEIASSQTRINAKASWNTLIFIINGFVFTLIGLELPHIIHSFYSHSFYELLLRGICISVAVILIRLVWVYAIAYFSRLFFPSIKRYDPMPAANILFTLGWTGMRGIVSLAAVLSIPYQLSSGVPFPHRNLFLFITYCVIVVTLIIPSITLPALFHFFKINGAENKLKEEALARLLSLQGALATLEEIVKKEKIPDPIFQDFCKQINRRLKVIETQLNDTPYSTLTDEFTALKKLTLAAINSERDTLLKLRGSGEIHDEVFHLLSDELDLEEMRARTLRI